MARKKVRSNHLKKKKLSCSLCYNSFSCQLHWASSINFEKKSILAASWHLKTGRLKMSKSCNPESNMKHKILNSFSEGKEHKHIKAHCVARRGLGDHCSVLDSDWLFTWLLQLKFLHLHFFYMCCLNSFCRDWRSSEASLILTILAYLNFLLKQ